MFGEGCPLQWSWQLWKGHAWNSEGGRGHTPRQSDQLNQPWRLISGCPAAVRSPSQNHTTEMSSVKGLAGKGKRPLTKMTSKTCSCPIHYFAPMNFILNQIQPLQGGVCVTSLVCPSAVAGLRLWVARTASAIPCACWVLGLIWVFFFFLFS